MIWKTPWIAEYFASGMQMQSAYARDFFIWQINSIELNETNLHAGPSWT
jgi:hypothetical protein